MELLVEEDCVEVVLVKLVDAISNFPGSVEGFEDPVDVFPG